MGNKVTLKQIAQEVGLSPSSVSLVLNNRPCRISEENRKLIKEVAARNHYVPNQIARSLVMRESRTLEPYRSQYREPLFCLARRQLGKALPRGRLRALYYQLGWKCRRRS